MAREKIVVTTMVWKRFELFEVWARALLDVVPDNVEVLVAGSEGEDSQALVEKFGFHYIEVPNRPIGHKANVRFAACEKLDPDYVILCGSDDIVSRLTFEYYLNQVREEIDEVCINDIYYLNAHTGEMAYSPGYVDHRAGEPVAPWRMLNRRMCDELGWKGWDDSERLFLDGHIYRRLANIPHSSHRIHVRRQDLFVCDVKTQVNMTPYVLRPHWKKISPPILEQHLSPKVVADLEALKGPITNRTFLGVDYLDR